MKNKELIERVASKYNRGAASDDSRLTSRHIFSVLNTLRMQLNQEQLDKNKELDDANFIVINCVKLIQVPEQECPCLPAGGCKVWRSENQILGNEIISWVMTHRNKIITKETRDSYRNVDGNKYTKENLRYIYENKYLYVYGKHVPPVIKLRQFIEDPLELLTLKNSCDDSTEDSNSSACADINEMEFPIDGNLINRLILMSYQELLSIFSQNQQDVYNNSLDDKSPLNITTQNDGKN